MVGNLETIERIERYAGGRPDAFENNELIRNWVVGHIQIIGEVCNPVRVVRTTRATPELTSEWKRRGKNAYNTHRRGGPGHSTPGVPRGR